LYNVLFILLIAAFLGIAIYGVGTRRGRAQLKTQMRRRSPMSRWGLSGLTPLSAAAPSEYLKRSEGGCPNCHMPLPVAEELAQCPHCHWHLHSQDKKLTVAEEGKCPKCKNVIRAGVAKCPFCGWRFDAEASEDGQHRKIGYVSRDVVIGGAVAFKEGELVSIESESPDPGHPEYKYVVNSKTLSKRFRLSDGELKL
jgi:RNA polymerase subunit RPABC4/transcription elongation factor Spt4